MVVKGLNPSVVLENRIKIAKGLIEKYRFTAEDLAVYFQSSPTQIKNFCEKYELNPHNHQFDVNKKRVENLVLKRDKMIQRQRNMVSTLENNGLWHIAEVKTVPDDKISKVADADNVQKAIDYMQKGFSLGDIKSYIGVKTKVSLDTLKTVISENNLTVGVGTRTSKETYDTVKDMVQNGHNYEDALTVTNLSGGAREYRFFKNNNDYEEYKTFIENNIAKQIAKQREKHEGSSSQRKSSYTDERKEEAFRRWTSAEKTQAELAIEYGVDRMTIVNWCREMKVKYRDEIEQPTVRRRNLSQKTLEERGLTHYDNPGMLRVGSTRNSEYLQGESYFKSASDEERQISSDMSKEMYRQKNDIIFGYGPNKGTSFKDGKLQKGYVQRRQRATELGREFATVEGAREHANTHDGEMKSFWDEKYSVAEKSDEIER